jgi:hypothetical protein
LLINWVRSKIVSPGLKTLCERWKRKLWRPLRRLGGPQVKTFRHLYEKAGLRVADEPVPWNAEAILLHALVRLPGSSTWCKSDFQLRVSGRPPLLPFCLQPAEGEDLFDVFFRCAPLQRPALVSLFGQGLLLAQLQVPFLSAECFLRDLRLEAPTVSACLGKLSVACQTVVAGQCRCLVASGLLTSPTSLVPLIDFDLGVELLDQGTGQKQLFSFRLTTGQLRSKQTHLCVSLGTGLPLFGTQTIRWRLDDRLLALTGLRVVSRATLQRSLFLVESRYLYQEPQGALAFSHHLPAGASLGCLRPCFLLGSQEPGMAAVCPLEVRVQFRDATRPPLVLRQELVVLDGPSLCAPTGPGMDDHQDIRAFELFSEGRLLGTLSLSLTPVASFTPEGGFRASEDYPWTPLNEEEMLERLQKLMEVGVEPSSLQASSPIV